MRALRLTPAQLCLPAAVRRRRCRLLYSFAASDWARGVEQLCELARSSGREGQTAVGLAHEWEPHGDLR